MVRFNTREEVTRQVDENMLKTLYLIKLKQGKVHVVDLARELDMAITTAYSAMRRLVESGYVQPLEAHRGGRISNKQPVIFTAEGLRLAQKIAERHQLIQGWLLDLGIPEEEADQEACHMEHGVTDATMKAIQDHVTTMKQRFGETICQNIPPEKIPEMMAMMKPKRPNNIKTIREKLEIAIEQAGGTEGIERKCALVNRAGGAEKLALILDVVESLGGAEVLQEEKDELLLLKRQAELRGGAGALEQSFALIDEIGGAEGVQRERAERERLAGELEAARRACAQAEEKIKQLEETCQSRDGELERKMEGLQAAVDGLGGPDMILRIQETAGPFGGVEKMLRFASKTKRALEEWNRE